LNVARDLTLIVPPDVYRRQLQVLGAWWCLGSSGVTPELLLRYLTWTPPPAWRAAA
jgi:hypothetical protein